MARHYEYPKNTDAGRWMRQHHQKEVYASEAIADRELVKFSATLADGGERLKVYDCRWTDQQGQSSETHWHIGRERRERKSGPRRGRRR